MNKQWAWSQIKDLGKLYRLFSGGSCGGCFIGRNFCFWSTFRFHFFGGLFNHCICLFGGWGLLFACVHEICVHSKTLDNDMCIQKRATKVSSHQQTYISHRARARFTKKIDAVVTTRGAFAPVKKLNRFLTPFPYRDLLYQIYIIANPQNFARPWALKTHKNTFSSKEDARPMWPGIFPERCETLLCHYGAFQKTLSAKLCDVLGVALPALPMMIVSPLLLYTSI